MKYYDVSKNWTKKISPHIADVYDILINDFNEFLIDNAKDRNLPYPIKFTLGEHPFDYESVGWYLHRKGPLPRYYGFTRHGACHYLVNTNLKLITLAEPSKTWKIITSTKHSTVWDGDQTLFDINYFAYEVSPEECFKTANKRHLKPGQYLRFGKVGILKKIENNT